jgi:lysophospholipase L1-like esterase
VVISPLARRTFHDGKPSNADLGSYATAARRVAEQQDVTFLDLLAISDALLSKMSQAEADEFDAAGHPDQKAENGAASGVAALDRTHLDEYGKRVFGRVIADNLVRTLVELGPDVIGVPAAQHPALFLVGDSIMHTGSGNGETGPWGWGSEFIPMFDAAKIHVYNDALGGRSSRSFIEEGLWQNILDQLRPGDWVIAQFGNNDSGNSKDHPDRTTLKGDGEDTQVIESPVTQEPETIHSYGWYMRQYVNDAKRRG